MGIREDGDPKCTPRLGIAGPRVAVLHPVGPQGSIGQPRVRASLPVTWPSSISLWASWALARGKVRET